METGKEQETYTPEAHGRHAVEPYAELLETRVMARILDDVVHGVPAEQIEATSPEEREFARRAQQDVEEKLAEAAEEGSTSYVDWQVGPACGERP